ncbi:MAG: S24/S26 family peptidase [Elusimicrobiota bacterium]
MKLNALKLKGGSMRPLMKTGDTALVSEYSEYNPGDILAYRLGETTYIHRLIKKSGRLYYLRGDSGIPRGHWVEENSIVGLVRNSFPAGITGIMLNILARKIFEITRAVKRLIFINGENFFHQTMK